MKRKLLCGMLALTLATGSAAAAFTDISDTGTLQAAAVLDALGIMQGVGGDRFDPGGQLTRGQFCKLAVTALGIDDVSAYQSYTIFPDVPASHWAAGYVGAALKQATVKDKQIIRGFADGTFGPDKPISYGEVCTMLLRMLDYQVADVGPFWPADYIAKAESLGLNRGAASYGASDIVRRGDAAILLLNTLQAQPKDGEAKLLTAVSSKATEDAILVATSLTDSNLRESQAKFYISGALATYSLTGSIDRSLIGTQGTLLFDKVETAKVRAFLPETTSSEQVEVTLATASKLETTTGNYTIPNDTPVVLGGEMLTYGTAWFDLTPGYKLNLYYNEDGSISLLSAALSSSGTGSFVFGVSNSPAVPNGYTVVKNGVPIERTKLRQFDLVTLADNQAIVSDKRVTGYLMDAEPSFVHPTRVTMLGRSFSIPNHAAAYFENMQYGDRITLLLDGAGTVQAAYPAAQVSGNMVGVYLGDNKVSLINGVTITGASVTAEGSAVSNAENLVGQLVSVNERKGGALSLSGYTLSGGYRGEWTVSEGTLGSSRVSPNVKLYESAGKGMAVKEVSLNDLTTDTIPATNIRATLLDTSGSIIGIVLDDITGSAWMYGLAGISSVDSEGRVSYTVTLRTFIDGKPTERTFQTDSRPGGLGSGPVGISTTAPNAEGKVKLTVKSLRSVGEVALNAFDGTDGVRTSEGYYPLPEDVAVFVGDNRSSITLREAKANYEKFTLYVDDTIANGGKIRVIYAKK